MATRYWVGGTATWDATVGTKWAATSGGAGGVSVPTSADDVFFNGIATGGGVAGAFTCTLSSTSVARSLNCTGLGSGHVISHPASTTLTIGDATAGAGNVALKFVAGMTYSLGSTTTSALNFISTSATVQTIDCGSKNIGNTTFNGAGGSWQLTSALTTAQTASNILTLTAGTLDTNGQVFIDKPSGVVSGDYLSIKDSNARGSTYWAAGNNSINAGNNTGWAFTTPGNMEGAFFALIS